MTKEIKELLGKVKAYWGRDTLNTPPNLREQHDIAWERLRELGVFSKQG
jgi:hypothetical protein